MAIRRFSKEVEAELQQLDEKNALQRETAQKIIDLLRSNGTSYEIALGSLHTAQRQLNKLQQKLLSETAI